MKALSILSILAIIACLAIASYAHYRIDQLRADNEVVYAMAQANMQKFIEYKSMIQEGNWKKQGR